MTNRRLKKAVIPVIYGIVGLCLIVGVFLIEKVISNSTFKENEDFKYVDDTIFDEDIPVVSPEKSIIRPYTDDKVKVLKKFYDYQGEASQQQESILYYENTYLQNSGVTYGGVDSFDVVAIMDGTVIDVKEDQALGKIVEIRHSNDLISVYQSLGQVNVKKDDSVKQGTVIATSGQSNIEKDLKSHLHFELIYKGQTVNPEDYYDKLISEM